MLDKIGAAGAVQTQACQSPAAPLASMVAFKSQSAAAWSNSAQSTSGLHHAACLEALAAAGQQQGTAHHATAPHHHCGMAHIISPLLALVRSSQVAAMRSSITAVCLQPSPLVVCMMTPLHTQWCAVYFA